ncbi:hypothetical protein BJ878DRAFT_501190 [Calycina marina]|uniref:Uncharacterized protein n=1 Tax=Calycina marina TaxID=1763456 RepID=A0A9P8CG99_9HELO|nr:hypothetical protein BJ878DRAFT_501190 [Calycina marina]
MIREPEVLRNGSSTLGYSVITLQNHQPSRDIDKPRLDEVQGQPEKDKKAITYIRVMGDRALERSSGGTQTAILEDAEDRSRTKTFIFIFIFVFPWVWATEVLRWTIVVRATGRRKRAAPHTTLGNELRAGLIFGSYFSSSSALMSASHLAFI